MKARDSSDKKLTRRKFLSALGIGAAGIAMNNSFYLQVKPLQEVPLGENPIS